MYALVQNDQVIKLFTGTTQFFDKDGIGYAPSYLRQWTPTEKADHGIYEIVYGARKDDGYYLNQENSPTFADGVVSITYTSTARELEDSGSGDTLVKGLKTKSIEQIKLTANSMLKTTDWTVVRKIERDVAIPTDIAAQRAAIVAEQDRLETAIAAAADVDALKAIVESADFSVKS